MSGALLGCSCTLLRGGARLSDARAEAPAMLGELPRLPLDFHVACAPPTELAA